MEEVLDRSGRINYGIENGYLYRVIPVGQGGPKSPRIEPLSPITTIKILATV
jgi:hypothetical protein